VEVPIELVRQMQQWGEHVRMLCIHFERIKWNRPSYEKYQLIRDVAGYFPNVNLNKLMRHYTYCTVYSIPNLYFP